MRIFSRKRKHFRWADKNTKNVRKKLSIYGQGICMNHGIVCLAYIQISLCYFQKIRNTLPIRRIRLIQFLEIYLIQGRWVQITGKNFNDFPWNIIDCSTLNAMYWTFVLRIHCFNNLHGENQSCMDLEVSFFVECTRKATRKGYNLYHIRNMVKYWKNWCLIPLWSFNTFENISSSGAVKGCLANQVHQIFPTQPILF